MSSNYDLLNLYSSPQQEESGKYFGLSIAVHVAIAIGSFFVVVPQLENLKKDIVTIELVSEDKPVFIEPVKKLSVEPKGEKIAATQGAERTFEPAASAPLEAETAEVIKGPVQKLKASKAKAAQVKTHTGGGEKAVAKSAASRVGVPETLEDIAAPDLDMDGVDVAQVGNLGDNEFENEFKNVDKSNEAAINAQRAELDQEAKEVADEKDAALQAIAEENAAKAKAMDDALAATRTKNAAAMAQMKATEKAAAEKAAREAELAAVAASAKNHGSGTNHPSEGRGNGATGADRIAKNNAGDPNAVRSLDQLRQMPGNPKPQYSKEERFKREAGVVIFRAYVTNEGHTSQFTLVQPTGYRNLDGKTLAALKKWRFYPGQQGWVEIPFKWNLNGEVEQITKNELRRFGSNGN